MINVYLDDLRPCPKGFVAAKNVEECIMLLESEDVDVLSLDFDLGWHQPTGIEVAQWIVQHQRYPREIFLHTSSSIGRSKMLQTLYPNKPEHTRIHLFPIPDTRLAEIASKA